MFISPCSSEHNTHNVEGTLKFCTLKIPHMERQNNSRITCIKNNFLGGIRKSSLAPVLTQQQTNRHEQPNRAIHPTALQCRKSKLAYPCNNLW